MNDSSVSDADSNPDRRKQSALFDEERVHLEATLDKLSCAFARATSLFDRTDGSYLATKFYMAENRGDIDPQEMYQNELYLKEVDRSAEAAHLSRERLAQLLDAPYFAKVVFRPDGEGDAKASYIGKFAFSHEGAVEISDWRSPVAGLFYDFDIGKASYCAPSGAVTGLLEGKRQIKIQDGTLVYAVDDESGIRDEVMQRELSRTSDAAMRSIISSIQKEQNHIIRYEAAGTLVIQGVAGSGKTSIALHRIAYLLYRRKDSLDSNAVVILSPNKVFGDYIAHVLPELGEEPVRETDLRTIAETLLGPAPVIAAERHPVDDTDTAWRTRARYKGSIAFAEAVVAAAERFRVEAFAGTDTVFAGKTFAGSWLTDRYRSYGELAITERLELLASEIIADLNAQRIGRRQAVPKKSEVRRKLTTMLRAKDALGLYRWFLREEGCEDMLVAAPKNTVEWEDACALAYFQTSFDGFEAFSDIKHLVVDEMQDLTPIQHLLIARLFPCEKTVLGDFGQAVDPANGMTLDAMRAVYDSAEVFRLKRSYRSTLEINELALRVKPSSDLVAVQRHGTPPCILRCTDTSGVLAKLDELMQAFEASEFKTLGIIHKSEKVARAYHGLLSNDHRVHLLAGDSASFTGGISIASVKMAKGLEFDEVVILDADESQYANAYERSLLYVAVTRAMHKLTILYRTESTPFLLQGAK